jgi:hypothetical protein
MPGTTGSVAVVETTTGVDVDVCWKSVPNVTFVPIRLACAWGSAASINDR